MRTFLLFVFVICFSNFGLFGQDIINSDGIIAAKAKIKKLGGSEYFHRPYQGMIICQFLDSPDAQVAAKYFQVLLQKKLAKCPSLNFSVTVTKEIIPLEIFEQSSPTLSKFSKLLNQYEWLGLFSCSLADKSSQFRFISKQQISQTEVQNFEGSSPDVSQVANFITTRLPWEGRIVFQKDQEVKVAMRVNSSDLIPRVGQTAPYYFLSTGRRSFCIRIREFRQVDSFWLGNGEYLSDRYKVPENTLFQQIHFPQISQTYQIIDSNQKPLAGFSIFANYGGFSMDRKDYITTTDLSGNFVVSNIEKKPIFLVIAKNFEGINFSFSQRILLIDKKSPKITFTVKGIKKAEEMAKKLLPERLKKQKEEEVNRKIQVYLDEAQDKIYNQNFQGAIITIRLAQEKLREIKGSVNYQTLQKKLQRIEKNYQEALLRKENREKYLIAMKLLEDADRRVAKLDYSGAQKKFLEAKVNWPKDLYKKEFVEVTQREKRLIHIVRELGEPIGQARVYIQRNVFKWRVEDISLEKLRELSQHLRVLFTQGEMDKEKFYNDVNLWLELRVFLDKRSQEMANKAQEYLNQYNRTKDLRQREKVYEEHEKYYEGKRIIDGWLETFHN